jgi:hypothetical protein
MGRAESTIPARTTKSAGRQASFPPEVSTEVHVNFEPAGPEETRVSVEHYGWDTLPAEHPARHGFPPSIFGLRFVEWWQELLAGAFPSVPGLTTRNSHP